MNLGFPNGIAIKPSAAIAIRVIRVERNKVDLVSIFLISIKRLSRGGPFAQPSYKI